MNAKDPRQFIKCGGSLVAVDRIAAIQVSETDPQGLIVLLDGRSFLCLAQDAKSAVEAIEKLEAVKQV